MDQPACVRTRRRWCLLEETLMLTPHWRKVLRSSCLFAALTVLGTGLARVTAKAATEAPAGFNTPTLNGAQSMRTRTAEEPAHISHKLTFDVPKR